MASRWKRLSIVSKYLRSRSCSVGGGSRARPVQHLPKRNHGFQVRARFSDDIDSGRPESSQLSGIYSVQHHGCGRPDG